MIHVEKKDDEKNDRQRNVEVGVRDDGIAMKCAGVETQNGAAST